MAGLGSLPFDWEQAESEPAAYMEIELTVAQWKFLSDVAHRERSRPKAKAARALWASIERELQLARRMEGERARLPWRELEAEARRQGVSVIDVLFDRAHGREA